MFKPSFLTASKNGLAAVVVFCFAQVGLNAQTHCFAQNFVGTELRAEPTDSLEENVVEEIPLKSDMTILYKTDNGYYFAAFGSKFGYVNAATVSFKESRCRSSLAYHPHSPTNAPGRDIYAEIKRQVEREINQWQQKAEFEKSADYAKRVNEHTRADKIKEVSKEVIRSLKRIELYKICNQTFNLSPYDADHETFLINTTYYGDFAIGVPIASAPMFKSKWNEVSFDSVDFEVRDKRLFISRINFHFSQDLNEVFSFNDDKAVTYENAKIVYNFEPIRIESASDSEDHTYKRKEHIAVAGQADIDADVPKCTESHENYFAVIIGNENYAREIKVHFALDDSRSVKEYFINTLGIPDRNIRYLEDATYGQMLSEIDWLNGITKAYDGKVKLFFYYAGHGIPNAESRSSYLLPVDGYASNTGTAVKTEYLYAKLVENSPQLATVFLDACFSGGARDGTLAGGRSVSIRPKKDALKGNIVVLSAASEDETAYPYSEKMHGLFTYFLLKKIRDSKADVSVGELADYIRQNVNQQSMILHAKTQTPTLNCGNEIAGVSRNLKIK